MSKRLFADSLASGRVLKPLAGLSLSLLLASCGGGGGAGSALSSIGSAFSGLALDAPVAAAAVTITSGAPVGDPGATVLGTGTAGPDGSFTVSGLVLPSSTAPIFATVTSPSNTALVMTSFIGPANTINAAGSTLTSSVLPDLDVTPVTTAALAVYAQLNGGPSAYANLTPTLYSQTLLANRSDILAIAAAIKAVGDGLCAPIPAVTNTTVLAVSIASAANLGTSSASATLTTAGTTLGGNCPAVMAGLTQQIAADPHFGPELDLGDVVDAGVPLAMAAGTYSLQGVVAELGTTPGSLLNPVLVTGVPAANVIVDGAVILAANGAITSTDGNVTGQLNGNMLTLNVIDGPSHYAFTGKVGVLPAQLLSSGNGYAIRSGGTNTVTNDLTQFQAVLVPVGSTPVTPVWNGWTFNTASNTQDGFSCATGDLLRMDILGGSALGGAKLGECLVPGVTGWSLTPATPPVASSGDYFDDRGGAVKTVLVAPALTATSWTKVAPAPFVLTSAAASLTEAAPTGTGSVTESGTMYYVMGGDSAVFTWTTVGAPPVVTNTLFGLHDNPLTQLAEMASTTTTTGGQNSQDHPNSTPNTSMDH